MTQFDNAKDLIDAIEAYTSATADEAVAGNDMEGTRSGDVERMTSAIVLQRLVATFRTVTGWTPTFTPAQPIYKKGRFTGEWTAPTWDLNKEDPHAERAM